MDGLHKGDKVQCNHEQATCTNITTEKMEKKETKGKEIKDALKTYIAFSPLLFNYSTQYKKEIVNEAAK
jgi:hypothetical protein